MRVSSGRAIFVGIGLMLATFLVYSPVLKSTFVNIDDGVYVTDNPQVKAGLSRENLSWAFSSITAANWHPLTMLSLLADSQLSSKEPETGRPSAMLFHLTNLVLHCLSSFVLFWTLLRMTGCLWRCFWVAALFALHPLHVESVAWVAERKDVLSGLFWMLAMLAYARYARVPNWKRMLVVALMMALGLLAKPMLVTLPLVFLLLDYWPLGRLDPSRSTFIVARARKSPDDTQRLWMLVREKVPFLILTAVFCAITLVAQWRGQALRSFSDIPFLIRCQNIPVAYVVYLRKMIWPSDLSPFWALGADGWPAWQVASALVLLIGVTAAAWIERARRPYLLVGWLWYLGTLVPVIGLIQVGDQAWADRYTYLPLIGIFMAVAWGVPDLLESWRSKRAIVAALGLSTVLVFSFLTRLQVAHWQDDFHLWQHTLDVQPKNDLAHNNLAVAFADEGKLGQALDHYAAAVAANPSNGIAQVNLGMTLNKLGRQAEAIERLRIALELNPASDGAHAVLGRLLLLHGEVDNAVSHFREALRLRPDASDYYFYLAEALMAADNFDEAAAVASEGLRLAPGFAAGHHQLGMALVRLQRWPDAHASLQTAVNLLPQEASFRCDLALAFYELGQKQKALDQYARANDLQPDWISRSLATAESLLNRPGSTRHLYNRARELAQEMCQATDYRNPELLATLAAAYAATGYDTKARQMAEKALELAGAAGQGELAKKIRARMSSYQNSIRK
jgi:tetratricopeptide (TPR) repeat protein